MKTICYHHNDLDGICAAAVVRTKYPGAKMVSVNYGYEWEEEDVKDAIVIVVDFSFPDMKALNIAAGHLIWMDHHVTAQEQQEDMWFDKSVEGFRTIAFAGCALTWMHFYPDDDIPLIVAHIADMDMWKFELEDTKTICECANVIFTNPDHPLLQRLLEANDLVALDKIYQNGEVLLEGKERRVKSNFDNGQDAIIWGHTFRVINCNHDISETGAYVYGQDKYEAALMWFARGDEVILSFRSNTVDVGDIALSLGGGGHKAASGATITMSQMMNIWKMCI